MAASLGLRIAIPEVSTMNMGCATPDGRFRVKRCLGAGLEADVYAVEALADDGHAVAGELALKVLRPAFYQPLAELQRLCRETRHPNVLRARPLPQDAARVTGAAATFDLDVLDPQGPAGASASMIACELCERDLLQLVRQAPSQRLPESRACAVARDVARGLAHCHAVGWFHLDVKPENVLLRRDGSAVLADFGCAVRLPGRPGRRRSRPGPNEPRRAVGSTAYLPEECFGPRGSPHLSPQTGRVDEDEARALAALDSWGLGVTLFAALTGRQPWSRACLDDAAYARYRAIRMERRRFGGGTGDVTLTDDRERRALIEALHWPADLTPRIQELLLGLLEPTANRRWTVAVALRCLEEGDAGALQPAVAPSTQASRKRRLPVTPPALQGIPALNLCASAGCSFEAEVTPPPTSKTATFRYRANSASPAKGIGARGSGRGTVPRRPPASLRYYLRAAPSPKGRLSPQLFRLAAANKANILAARKRALGSVAAGAV